ncbi:MAG TPA: hypothetical protein VKZ59_11585 [Acidobacteriota bacterium]|nr:hypothetical protein [Acidobacteriota bacterium]
MTLTTSLLYVVLSAIGATLAGAGLNRWVLPVLQTAVFFPVYFRHLQHKEWKQAFGLSLVWAVSLSATVSLLSWYAPERASEMIINGEQYQAEMFSWIATGEGAETDIGRFLPLQVTHLLLFTVLTLVSGGLLGLLMGSVLLNYMSFYVGTLLGHATNVIGVLALAWPPWAMLRVAGFILIAIVLSSLAYRRVGLQSLGFDLEKHIGRKGLILLILDILLKWGLAPLWQTWLSRLTVL